MLNIWDFINYTTATISILVFSGMALIFLGASIQHKTRKKNTPAITQFPFRAFLLSIGFFLLAIYFLIHFVGYGSDLAVHSDINIKIFAYLAVLIALFPKDRILPFFAAGIPLLGGKDPLIFIPIILSIAILSVLFKHNNKRETKESGIVFLAFLMLAISESIFAVGGPVGALPWLIYSLAVISSSLIFLWWIGLYSRLDFKVRFSLVFNAMFIGILLMVGFVIFSMFSTYVETNAKNDSIHDVNFALDKIDNLKSNSANNAYYNAKEKGLIDYIDGKSQKFDFSNLNNDLGKTKPDFMLVIDKDSIVKKQLGFPLKDGDKYPNSFIESSLSRTQSIITDVPLSNQLMVISSSPISENNILLGYSMSGYYLDNSFVDSLKDKVGTAFTLFKDNTRVSATYSATSPNSRLLGTVQDDATILKTVLTDGKQYAGLAYKNKKPIIVAYAPLKGVKNNGKDISIIGMVGSGVTLESATNSINSITIIIFIVSFVTTLISVIVLQPLAFINEYLSIRTKSYKIVEKK